MLKVLSVKQPWATLIMLGKSVENRTWGTSYRGFLAIHASKSRPPGDWHDYLPTGHGQLALPKFNEIPCGAILGSVELFDCLPFGSMPVNVWAEGPWCWLLRNPVMLETPFPCKGSLGLWAPPKELSL